jgi:hypothetical protein
MNIRIKANTKWLVFLCAIALGISGCFTKRPPSTRPMGVFHFAHPVMPIATEEALEPPPDVQIEAVGAPPQIVTNHSLPARPRAGANAAAGHVPAEKSEEPFIAPELTSAESAAAKAETQSNLDLVEKKLALVRGKALNASQQDLLSKIRGFTENAREAMRSSDWVRARNSSKKAVVLSEQLTEGL